MNNNNNNVLLSKNTNTIYHIEYQEYYFIFVFDVCIPFLLSQDKNYEIIKLKSTVYILVRTFAFTFKLIQ
jgi:hypothetical protein